jgi:hypothetical protein
MRPCKARFCRLFVSATFCFSLIFIYVLPVQKATARSTRENLPECRDYVIQPILYLHDMPHGNKERNTAPASRS